jgi:hypothetical protein
MWTLDRVRCYFDLLLPQLRDLVVDRVERGTDAVVVDARATASTADCPGCGTTARRVHGRYQRLLRDTLLAGTPVPIRLQVGRLVCEAAGCERRSFAEQINGLTVAHARYKPAALTAVAVAVALASRAGARLACASGMPVGWHRTIKQRAIVGAAAGLHRRWPTLAGVHRTELVKVLEGRVLPGWLLGADGPGPRIGLGRRRHGGREGWR